MDERALVTGKSVPGSVMLENDHDDISRYWPATTPRYLHVIVERPPGKCCVIWVREISLTVS